MSEMWSPQHADSIGGWTPAELRRFVVNTILNDPGAMPEKEPTPLGAGFPTTFTDQDVPTWDKASQSWKTRGRLDDVSYIRINGSGFSGFVADTNFRIYDLASPSVTLEQDVKGRVSMNGSGRISIAVPGNYLLGGYVVGRAALYECAWTLIYNGTTIDSAAQNGANWGGLGVVQNLGVSFSVMTSFFSSPGYVQLGGFQNDATIPSAGMWAMWLPS